MANAVGSTSNQLHLALVGETGYLDFSPHNEISKLGVLFCRLVHITVLQKSFQLTPFMSDYDQLSILEPISIQKAKIAMEILVFCCLNATILSRVVFKASNYIPFACDDAK